MNSAVRGKSARDAVDDVGDVRRAAADEDRHPGRRRERARRAAQVADERPALVAVRAVRRVDVNAVRSPFVVAARAVATNRSRGPFGSP